MVAIHELYAADFGTWLNGLRSTFHRERFDDYHTVAILQDIPIGVIYGAFLRDIFRVPFVTTFRTLRARPFRRHTAIYIQDRAGN